MNNNHEEYYNQEIFDQFLDFLENDSETFVTFMMVFLLIYIVACVMLIVGALKFMKWLLMPFILIELFRLLALLIIHVITMIVSKKTLDLGQLIAVTIAGGFAICKFFWNFL